MISLGRVNGRTRQNRCKWCRIFSDQQDNYSSYKYKECNVVLCVKNSAETSRDCFDQHLRVLATHLARLTCPDNIRLARKNYAAANDKIS